MIIMFILKRPAQRMGDVPYKKWQCGACGFIYDEELGDEEEGFPPGTRFKDIDDNVYTYLSCDVSGSYFKQWMNTFQPNRVYKIIYKLKYTDNQEQIFDNNFEFKVTR